MSAAPVDRDDPWTVAAIGILAACIVTVDHEAIGHGTACLLSGGTITRLTSVYFRCDVGSPWTAIGGPLGNLAGAAIAWIVSRLAPARCVRLQLLLLLITAFGLFWEAGYLFQSMFLGDGDWYFAVRDNLGSVGTLWRIGGFALGLALYLVGGQATRASLRRIGGGNLRANVLLRVPWLAGTIAAASAALAYAPDRIAAVHDAALAIGGASWPLLIMPFFVRRPANNAPRIERNPTWIALAALAYAAFVLTLGRGLP